MSPQESIAVITSLGMIGFMVCRFILLSLLFFLSFAHALEVRVSSTLTAQQALIQIREERKAGDTSPATIVFPAGTTELLTPLTLEATDSNITFTGTQSTLIGGPMVTGWEKHSGEIVKADVSKLLPKGMVLVILLASEADTMSTLATSLITDLAPKVPKVMICVTLLRPYFCTT